MKTPSTDRRAYERYDVLGSLWGVLELPEAATILNVSRTGLLVETTVNAAPNAVHRVDMLVDGEPVRIHAIVRHCYAVERGIHRIGLEFLEVPTTVVMSVEQLGANHAERVE